MSERRKKVLDAAAMTVCVILHFYTGVRTFFENWYYTYTASSWIFLGLWLLCLLVLDVWLYFFRGAELLRSLKWFWGFSAVLAAGGLLMSTLSLSLDWAVILGMICAFVTPLYQLTAFAWLLFDELAGLRGSLRFGVWWSAMLLFCLIHFIYFIWLHRRAVKKGAPPDGPVDPGAGTVE
nr:hypothetical protein [uncultured Oscillibacter sp.]